jgi:tetratricopeptide (TPR) repeat protein
MYKSNGKYRSKLGESKVIEKAQVSKTLTNLLVTLSKNSNKDEVISKKTASTNLTKLTDPKRQELVDQPSVVEPLLEIPGVEKIRRALSECIDTGDLTQAVIDVIYHQERFISIEGLLLDYKRDIPTTKQAQIKILKSIQSFHNTYGGYLVFGADEVVKDIEIIPVHESIENFDFKILRDLCREYCTAPIEIQSCVHTVRRLGKTYKVTILHIPRRNDRTPVLTRKDAKDASSNCLMSRDVAYLREGDNSIPATTFYHWRLLFGPRNNPYNSKYDVVINRIRPIYSNLPDRDFICADFIGRKDYLSKLFAWLADDFTCVRVLAGEGGLGKTSIAYQFAAEVARENLVDAESVIWLTAKRYQFRAISNVYEELVNQHFSNSRELFQALAENLGEIRSDWSDLTEQDFPRMLRVLGQHLKIFFIIDDLDSLEINEQKRCIEVCQQLSGMGSRFLFTTRKNATASTSTAIEVNGLDEDDYDKLVTSWQERLNIKPVTAKDIRRLRETTHGSPLYTESLLRLVKNGMPIGEAIAKWKGNLGVDVRNAALKREVTQLSQEARKVLVATAIFGECSLAEIKLATDFSDQTLLDATDELQSLFLVNAPSIAAQPRFSISKTTKDLVLSLGPELISEYAAFQERIKNRRHNPKGESAAINSVGIAVNQAMALIAAGNVDDALKTVDEVNRTLKNKNKDMWFLRGRVLLKFEKPRLLDAKEAFMKAFDLGQRKALFFGMWYDTLLDLLHFEGAVEVSTSAIDASAGNKSDWLIKRANARLQSAGLQDKRGDTEHTVNQLKQAAEDFFLAASAEYALRKDATWEESFYRTHDGLWAVCTRSAKSVPEWLDAFDVQAKAIQHGDLRFESYARLKDAFEELRKLIEFGNSKTRRTDNFLSQLARRGLGILSDAPKDFRVYKLYAQIEKTFGAY